jgi:hypothetical protein
MADLGVQPHVIEAILNHVSGHKSGVAAIYNRSTYAAEKRAALELWASHLQTTIAKVGGANVTKMRKRAAARHALGGISTRHARGMWSGLNPLAHILRWCPPLRSACIRTPAVRKAALSWGRF